MFERRESASLSVFRNNAWGQKLEEVIRTACRLANARHRQTAEGLATDRCSRNLAIHVEIAHPESPAGASTVVLTSSPFLRPVTTSMKPGSDFSDSSVIMNSMSSAEKI